MKSGDYVQSDYLRDRMGSTVAVLDADANFVQTTGYYPSGTPYQLPEERLATKVDAATDRLHIGNPYLSHSGLNMYDNTARLHDPLLMRFGTPDPLYVKSLGASPWAHCSANPLNSIDPDGRADFFMVEDGVLKNVGTDGKEDDILAIVDKKVGKQIRKLTEAGQYYEGPVENSTSMAIAPTLDDLYKILEIAALANEKLVETGANKDKDGVIQMWDLGEPFKKDGNGGGVANLKAFYKDGVPLQDTNDSEWYFHTHFYSRKDGTGYSYPSVVDMNTDESKRQNGYKGCTFLIGGRDGKITFYYGQTVISTAIFNNLVRERKMQTFLHEMRNNRPSITLQRSFNINGTNYHF